MSRFAWLGRARWFRPALASVIVLSVVVGRRSVGMKR